MNAYTYLLVLEIYSSLFPKTETQSAEIIQTKVLNNTLKTYLGNTEP